MNITENFKRQIKRQFDTFSGTYSLRHAVKKLVIIEDMVFAIICIHDEYFADCLGYPWEKYPDKMKRLRMQYRQNSVRDCERNLRKRLKG